MSNELTVNEVNPQINTLLTRITATSIEEAKGALAQKRAILETISVFDTNAYLIYDFQDGQKVESSGRSLFKLVSETLNATTIDAIQSADRMILSSVLQQRVQDISQETNLERILPYCTEQIRSIKETAGVLRESTHYQKGKKIEISDSFKELQKTIVSHLSRLQSMKQDISDKTKDACSLFTLPAQSRSSADLNARQERGATMVLEIKELIDGRNGFRAQCIKTLSFLLNELPKSLEAINLTLSQNPNATDNDDHNTDTVDATKTTQHTQIPFEVFSTDGLDEGVLKEAGLTQEAKRVTFTELNAQKDTAQAKVDQLFGEIQRLVEHFEETKKTLVETRQEKCTLDIHIQFAETQARLQANTNGKSKVIFSQPHNLATLHTQTEELATQEQKLNKEYVETEQQISDLLSNIDNAEQELSTIQSEIDSLHTAYSEACNEYDLANKKYHLEEHNLKQRQNEIALQKESLHETYNTHTQDLLEEMEQCTARHQTNQTRLLDAIREAILSTRNIVKVNDKTLKDLPYQGPEARPAIQHEIHNHAGQYKHAATLLLDKKKEITEIRQKDETEYQEQMAHLHSAQEQLHNQLSYEIEQCERNLEELNSLIERAHQPVKAAHQALLEITQILGKDAEELSLNIPTLDSQSQSDTHQNTSDPETNVMGDNPDDIDCSMFD